MRSPKIVLALACSPRRSKPLDASHHCNNIVNTFKLISSYYHLRRSRLAIRNISNLHQQVHRGSRMRAHGRKRIAFIATILPTVSILFHFLSMPRAQRGKVKLSNLHQQVHRGSQRPQQSVITTLLQLVSRLFQLFYSYAVRVSRSDKLSNMKQKVQRGLSRMQPGRQASYSNNITNSFKLLLSTACERISRTHSQMQVYSK